MAHQLFFLVCKIFLILVVRYISRPRISLSLSVMLSKFLEQLIKYNDRPDYARYNEEYVSTESINL